MHMHTCKYTTRMHIHTCRWLLMGMGFMLKVYAFVDQFSQPFTSLSILVLSVGQVCVPAPSVPRSRRALPRSRRALPRSRRALTHTYGMAPTTHADDAHVPRTAMQPRPKTHAPRPYAPTLGSNL